MTNLKLNILKLNKLKLLGLAVLFCGPWVAPISSASWTKQSDDTLKVEIGAINPNFNFQVKAPGGNSAAFAKFMPNTVTKLSLGMSYRNLGMSTSFAPAPSDERQVKYGNSSGSDFQFRFYGKRTYEIFHQAYQGFYIQNSDQLDPAYATGGLGIRKTICVSVQSQRYEFLSPGKSYMSFSKSPDTNHPIAEQISTNIPLQSRT